MNKWKIDDNLYIVERHDIMPSSTKGLVKRFICTFDICTGEMDCYNYLIKKELYIALSDQGYWHTFTKKLCNDRQRVLYDADMPTGDLTLPVLCLEYNLVLRGEIA